MHAWAAITSSVTHCCRLWGFCTSCGLGMMVQRLLSSLDVFWNRWCAGECFRDGDIAGLCTAHNRLGLLMLQDGKEIRPQCECCGSVAGGAQLLCAGAPGLVLLAALVLFCCRMRHMPYAWHCTLCCAFLCTWGLCLGRGVVDPGACTPHDTGAATSRVQVSPSSSLFLVAGGRLRCV